MKILLRIAYAFTLAGILAFVNIDIQRRAVNNFYQKNGIKAVTNHDYRFFLKYIGNYRDSIYSHTTTEHHITLSFHNVYLDKPVYSQKKEAFTHDHVVIFLRVSKGQEYLNKTFYLFFSSGDKITRKPLTMVNYKHVPNLWVAQYNADNILIPKHFFEHKDDYDMKELNITMGEFTKNPGREYLEDVSGTINWDEELFYHKLSLQNEIKAIRNLKLDTDSYKQKLIENNIGIQEHLKLNILPLTLTFNCFYVAGSIILTYIIFFFPSFIRDMKRNKRLPSKIEIM